MEPVLPALKPLGDKVIVQPFEQGQERKEGMIIIPDTVNMKSVEGYVVAVSDEIKDVEVMDVVMFDYRACDPIEINKIKYIILPFDALLAVKK